MRYIYPLDEVRALTIHHYSARIKRQKVAEQNRYANAIANMNHVQAQHMLDKMRDSRKIDTAEHARMSEAVQRIADHIAQLTL